MTIKTFTALSLMTMLGLGVNLSCAAAEAPAAKHEAAPIAWRAEFNAANDYAGAEVLFEGRGGGARGEDVRIERVENGYLVLGLRPTDSRGRVSMVWGKNRWWAQVETEFGPFDLKQHPIIEVKYRKPGFLFYFDVTDASGEGTAFYSYDHEWIKTKVTDERGEWILATIRLSADSSVPGPHTLRYLNGLNLCVYGNPERELVREVDYVRIRGFTAEEAQAEADVIALLSDWPERDYPRLHEYFPYGGYTGDEGWWRGGGFEGHYGLLSRYHFNSKWVDDHGKWSRYAAHKEDDPDAYLEKSFANWTPQLDAKLAACEATGVTQVVDLRYATTEVMAKFGIGLARRWAKEVVARYGDNDAVFGYFLADEPFQSDVWPLTGLQRIIEDADPARPGIYVNCSTTSVKGFAPYSRINYWDKYTIHAKDRNPWHVGEWTAEMRKCDDAPQWAVLQSYVARPDYYDAGALGERSPRVKPSAAEARLMAYLALANGVKAIGWYCWYNANEVDLVDRFGTVDPLIEEVARVGWRCTTVGRRLLPCRLDDQAAVSIATAEPGDHNLSVKVHVNGDAALSYLVVVNEDVATAREGTITLAEPAAVMDLYSLNEVDADARSFEVDALAPGDARIYAVAADSETLQREAALVRAHCAEEVLRVVKPDLSIARRWQTDLAEVDALRKQAADAIAAGDGERALAAAHDARDALVRAMENHSVLAGVRSTLNEARSFLSQAQYMIMGRKQENLAKPAAATKDLYDSFLKLGHEFSGCMSDFIAGKTEGLPARAEAARMSAREHLLRAIAATRGAIEKEE